MTVFNNTDPETEPHLDGRAAGRIAVVVAGGNGLRMQSPEKKQFMDLRGIPVIVRTLAVFDGHPEVDAIVLVIPAADMDFCRNELLLSRDITTPLYLVCGGPTRQDSVKSGLDMAAELADKSDGAMVLVHDGVRPFVPPALIDSCLDAAWKTGAAIPALTITDTVKLSADGKAVDQTLDRNHLYRAQTPQVFRLDNILTAFVRADDTGFSATDEASIVEHAGMDVSLVKGARYNLKLTTPEDLDLAGYLLDQGLV